MGKFNKKSLKKLKNATSAKQLTRKELRKQKLQKKKENKRIFFSGKVKEQQTPLKDTSERSIPSATSKSKGRKKNSKKKEPQKIISINELLSGKVDTDNDESITSDSDESIPSKPIRKQNQSANSAPQKNIKLNVNIRPDAVELRRRDLQRQKELEISARKQRIKQLARENEEEDKVIAQLEKKLKLNKTKDKNRLVRKMFSDGLDYALEFCLDDEEEERKRLLKEKRKEQEQRRHDDDDDDWSEEEIGGGDIESDGVENDMEDYEMDENDSNHHEDKDEAQTSEDSNETEQDQYKEDIYGRKRDKDGNVINEKSETQKYVPPHQRAQLTCDSKQSLQLQNLRRNCKGLLNRLSEANLHKIATGFEDLYMKNSRNNMNETIAALLNEALISKTLANERMIQEHVVLLAYLHAHVGSEIGAHFLQLFIQQFDVFINELNSLSVEDKRLNNLVLILSYLYIFKIYEHRLLLEIIEKLSGHLCEKSIECLLLIFQSVGFRLRKDDPLAFKQMMTNVQKKIADASLEMKENLRLKFMVDVLNAVKNNNLNKIPQFDPELMENLRKQLKAMLRNDKYVVTLNITINDLLRADQVGKWWVVGSAWSGNISDLGAAAQDNKSDATAEAEKQRFSEKLLTLARKQKMNTAERRNVFCILMSAEDYVDAFEKILHLALKDQRTIAYVILHCCLNEKHSNPYYSHLAFKFCSYNRKFQLAFQFAAWDRINEIESLNRQQIKNLASFLQHLILNGGLNLSVLKVVNFVQLDKLSFLLLKEVMVNLLLNNNEDEIYKTFEKVAKNPKLSQFKNSIRLFIQHFLLQQDSSKLKLTDDKMALLEKRVNKVDNLLAYVDL